MSTTTAPNDFLRPLRFLASLRLTVVCLGFGMSLIFLGTLAQVHLGIHHVQAQYFQSLFVFWSPPGASWKIPVLPGGYLLGAVLLVNLIAAHATRFEVSRKKIGIFLLHLGVILLLIGQLLTGLYARETQMRIDEGQTLGYSEAPREVELAVIDVSDPNYDQVVSIPEGALARGGTIQNPTLPFTLNIRRFYPNAQLAMRAQLPNPPPAVATMGFGAKVVATEIPRTVKDDERDLSAAVVEINGVQGSLGTWLLSNAIAEPQALTVNGKTYELVMRQRRFYKQFALTLQHFAHDRYAGTDIPKNFSSRVRLVDFERGENREVLISMNDPLRYRGFTFYQAGFDNNDKTTILQVVKNPAMWLPYIACGLVGLGLLVQFSMHLFGFVKKATSMNKSRPWILWVIVGLTIAFFLAPLGERDTRGGFEMQRFGRLPVLLNGRIKPLDTIARNSILITHGKQTLELEHGELSPIDWLAEVMFKPDEADSQKLFVIRSPETQAAIGQNGGIEKYFSFRELAPHLQEIEQQADLAQKEEAQVRSPFQRDIIKLFERVTLYHRLENTLEVAGTKDFKAQIDDLKRNIHPSPVPMNSGITAEALQSLGFLAETGYFFPIPPVPPNDDPLQWRKMGESLLQFITAGNMHPAVAAWATMATTYQANDPAAFNRAVDGYAGWLQEHFPGRVRKARVEAVFNQLQPFYNAMVIYVLIFILACASWLVWPQTLGRYAFALLVLTFVVHSAGLITRMYLEGRPPVTNLYSSAVFIGWGAVLLGIFLERFFRNGIGSATAAAIGYLTLLIAHHLSMDGDTMEMMRAVLDTNAWLATHVVMVTLGYASTFLAGFLALTYIVRGAFTPSLDRETAKSLARMVYGIVCFATLFSFVGTILGGIWADQSWGRFWGWDPKENGAALIVLWNAIILHARWGGLVRQRGLMVMAVFGNVVTSWSWFGVNMLGIGLHSYGFMDSAFPWLIGFGISQVLFMIVGALPPRAWRSQVESPVRSAPPAKDLALSEG